MSTIKPLGSEMQHIAAEMTGPQQWANKLVDNVACATQLDPEKDELPNVEDWRRNAVKLFEEAGAMIAALLESQTRLGSRVRELEAEVDRRKSQQAETYERVQPKERR